MGEVCDLLTGDVLDAVRGRRRVPYFITDEVYEMSIDFILAMDTLAANLATAAALCEAFFRGFSEGFNASGEGFNGEYAPRLTGDRFTALIQGASSDAWDWRPGCGRPAQGWGK